MPGKASGETTRIFNSGKLMAAILLATIIIAPRIAYSGEKAAPISSEKKEQKVIFNTKTKKYHGASCKWAIKCTKNCVEITLSEAIRRGGKACKICGGR